MFNPFRNRRPNKKRSEPRRVVNRVKLDADAYDDLRFDAYQRAKGMCECGCGKVASYFLRRPHPDAGDFAHDEHGSRKSDELSRGRWLNWMCHDLSHNAGGKPNPKKPGRMMSKAEAQRYLAGTACFCTGPKLKTEAFCISCLPKLSPQSRMNLEELTNRAWLQAVADCEVELMAESQKGDSHGRQEIIERRSQARDGNPSIAGSSVER